MTQIGNAYSAVGGIASWLGAAVQAEQVNGDGTGHRRRYEHGFLFWHPRTGVGVVPRGALWETWTVGSREHGALGYPTTRLTKNRPTKIAFEHGTLASTAERDRTVFAYNTQLISPFGYNGRGRTAQRNRLIEVVRASGADVVVLCEMMDDGDRTKVKSALAAIYPHHVEGPDEADIEEDGGLLLLSKHPIKGAQTIYRSCSGADCLANKGALLARVDPADGSPFFVTGTHLQASGATARDAQLRHLDSWLLAMVPPEIPNVVVGDFNLNMNSSASRSSLEENLPGCIDAWSERGDWLTPDARKKVGSGITSDKKSTYESGKLALDSAERGVTGSRIDLALVRQGDSTVMDVRDVSVERPALKPGVDLSDHYALKVRLGISGVRVRIDREIANVTVKMLGMHGLTVTSGAGVPAASAADDDEVRVSGSFQQGEAPSTSFKKKQVGISQNERYFYPTAPGTTFAGEDSVTATAKLTEVDPILWWEENEHIGTGSVVVSAMAQKLHAFGGRRYAPRVLRGDGSEYVALFHVNADLTPT